MYIHLDYRPGQNDDSGHFHQVFVWAPELGAWRSDIDSTDETVVQKRARSLMEQGIDPEYVRMTTIDYVIEEV
ncbi:hypothetical protein ACIOEX_25165 [Streptomyces sp. NPDC087850]|uniref:hypothetical protein n=1 Tax=Streptomyces sp. NPDC087850 TaxID=3365809 RepID=UPI00380D8535